MNARCRIRNQRQFVRGIEDTAADVAVDDLLRLLVVRRKQFALQIADDHADVAIGQRMLFFAACEQEQSAADLVDVPWNPAAVAIDSEHRRTIDPRITAPIRGRQTVLDVRLGLGEIHRFQAAAGDDPLLELLHPGRAHRAFELILTEQHQLHDWPPINLQVGQQAHRLECLVGQRLRLVDDDKDPALGTLDTANMPFDHQGQHGMIAAFHRQTHLVGQFAQQIGRRVLGRDQADADRLRRMAFGQQTFGQGGLAGPGCTGHDDDAFTPFQRIAKVGPGTGVAAVRKADPRIRQQTKGITAEVVKRFVHSFPLARSAHLARAISARIFPGSYSRRVN